MSSKKNKKKKEHQIPRFSEGQIDLIIDREFPADAHQVKSKFSRLKHYGLSIDRTIAAILKLADRDFDKIDGLIKGANTDPRDIISFAEYPRSNKYSWSELNELDEQEREKIRKDDWTEYNEWLNKEE